MILHLIYLGGGIRDARYFSFGGKLQRKPSPWSLFFRVQGGMLLAAHAFLCQKRGGLFQGKRGARGRGGLGEEGGARGRGGG